MILLLGGTGDAVRLARDLAAAGCPVLFSTATDIHLEIAPHPHIRRRWGRLDEEGMAALIRSAGVRAIVDATHPYAALAKQTAAGVARRLNIPCLTLLRPTGVTGEEGVIHAADHAEGAKLACADGRPVLLTTGAKNLTPYAEESRRTGSRLVVRVLPERSSLDACRAAGIEAEAIIAARGIFSVAENRAIIRRFGIGVLVTKDSGPAGGTPEKVVAARQEDCRIVVVRRPAQPLLDAFTDPAALIRAVTTITQNY